MAAEKEIVIRAKLDTSDSVSKVNELSNSFKKIDLSNTNQALAELNKRMEGGKLGMREMTQLMKQYQSVAAEAGYTSPIGQEALKNAGVLKDKLADLKAATTALAADGRKMQTAMSISNTAVGGYQAFIGISQLAGGENKKLMETMSKMIILQQTLNGLEQINAIFRRQSLVWIQALGVSYKILGVNAETASASTMKFVKAFSATVIGAIITGLILIVTNFKAIGEWIENAWIKIKNFTKDIPVLGQAIEILDVAFEKIGDAIQWVKELFGGLTREEQAFIDKQDEFIKSVENRAESIKSIYDKQIAIQEASGKKTVALEKDKNVALLKLYRDEVEAFSWKVKMGQELTDDEKKQYEDAKKNMSDMVTAILVMDAKRTKEQSDLYNKRKQQALEAKLTEEKISNDEIAAIKTYMTELVNAEKEKDEKLNAILNEFRIKKENYYKSDFELEQEKLTSEYEFEKQRLEQAGAAEEDLLALDEYYGNLSYELTKKQNAEKNKEADQHYKDLKAAEQSYGFSTIKNMGSVFSSLADLQDKGSKSQKKFALMSIIASQAESIAQAVVAASKAAAQFKLDPTGGFVRIAIWASTFGSILAGVLASVAQAKSILGEAGGGSGGVNAPNISGGNTLGAQQNEAASKYSTGNNSTTPSVTKVVVVESDITKAQQNQNYNNKISVL